MNTMLEVIEKKKIDLLKKSKDYEDRLFGKSIINESSFKVNHIVIIAGSALLAFFIFKKLKGSKPGIEQGLLDGGDQIKKNIDLQTLPDPTMVREFRDKIIIILLEIFRQILVRLIHKFGARNEEKNL